MTSSKFALTPLLLSALLLAACGSSTPNPPTTGGSGGGGGDGGDGGSGGTGGTGGSGGSGGTATGGSGGHMTGGAGGNIGGEGGATTPDAAPTPEPDAAAPAPDASAGDDVASTGGTGGSATGGTALMVVGAIPMIGDDVQIGKELAAKGLKVEPVLDTKAMVSDTVGKQLVILSYSLDSKRNFHQNFADIPVPIIVMEHGLLGTLGMADMHKWDEPATTITITAADSPLAAGFPAGDVTVYGKSGEIFWGIPSNEAIKVATAKGKPTWWVIFAYEKGKMMMTKPAPAKRLQFFMGAHLVPDMFMNANGLKLLDASIDWSIK